MIFTDNLCFKIIYLFSFFIQTHYFNSNSFPKPHTNASFYIRKRINLANEQKEKLYKNKYKTFILE